MNNTFKAQPWLLPAVALVGGLLIGWLVLGFLFPTVTFTNADPWDLRPEAKAQWVSMTADSFSLNGDKNLAAERMRGYTVDEINKALSELIAARNTQGRPLEAQRLQNFATTMNYKISPVTPAATRPAGSAPATSTAPTDALSGLLPILLGLVVLAALVVGGIMIVRRRQTAPVAETRPAMREEPEYEEPTARPAPSAAPMTVPAPAPARTAQAPAAAGSKPIFGTFAATYKFGDDNYDTSFSLETPRGDFLGETGMGISEMIGEGKPDKVTAFDLWLFDKGDVRTVTKILMSEYSYNDQTLRSKLAPKGELILAEKGKRILLETATLHVEAEIADLVYASTPGLPPNSHFQKLIVEMVPSQK